MQERDSEQARQAQLAATQGVSAERYATFQERTKQRRLETRLDAARAALRRRRLNDAAAALDEVIALDPQHAGLFTLTEEFDALRRGAATSRRGPWLAAGAAFAAMLLGASHLQESPSLISRQVAAASVLVPAAAPAPIAREAVRAIGTTGARAAFDALPGRMDALPPSPAESQDAAGDESAVIESVLLHQRLAWQGFDACDVRVSGDVATATCRGASRGWSFTLHKSGPDWKIDSVRAEP